MGEKESDKSWRIDIDSTNNDTDEGSIDPIGGETTSKLDIGNRLVLQDTRSYEGTVLVNKEEVDIKKAEQSKYFKGLFQGKASDSSEMGARQKSGLAGSPSASIYPQNDNNSEKSDDALDDSTKRWLNSLRSPEGELPKKLKELEPCLIQHVSDEIMDRNPNVCWEDIAGLDHPKKCLMEVIWLLQHPDISKGCGLTEKGLLLFGPKGTGKTMIGKVIARELKATFFKFSASSLTSEWSNQAENFVHALFGVARCRQPAVIFVDEIDFLLSQQKSSRRLKTQFLIEIEAVDWEKDKILLIGATNKPQKVDEAARQQFTKRLYIPLPSSEARAWIIRRNLEKDGMIELSDKEIDDICELTEGYSGSDMIKLVKDASLESLQVTNINGPVTFLDFLRALEKVTRPLVELGYEKWNKKFGSLAL